MSNTFEQAKAFFLQGLQAVQDGRLAEAESAFEASLRLVPGRASSLTNLGVVRVRQGRFREALGPLDAALAQEPDNVEALGHRAMARAELGQREAALDDTGRALQLQPRLGQAWGLRGTLLKELGRPAEAAAALEQAIALGSDVALHRYTLAGLRGDAAPPAPPEGYVQALFDAYAGQFDGHLVEVLQYRAPERLLAPLQARGLHVERALDLGCGTGLCGPLLQALARHRAGVDLSAAMLARAREGGCYDELVQADLVRFLDEDATAGWDLVVAADVFIYVGALERAFTALARRIVPGGLLCFSLEESADADLVLRPSLRYAHSEASVRALAQRHGFEVEAIRRETLRHEEGSPIPGLYCWLRRR